MSDKKDDTTPKWTEVEIRVFVFYTNSNKTRKTKLEKTLKSLTFESLRVSLSLFESLVSLSLFENVGVCVSLEVCVLNQHPRNLLMQPCAGATEALLQWKCSKWWEPLECVKCEFRSEPLIALGFQPIPTDEEFVLLPMPFIIEIIEYSNLQER